jgi:hypothetical protein
MALSECSLGRTQPPTHILDDMKIVLMRIQLLRSDMLNGERVVGGVRDHGIAVTVVVGRRQRRANFCKVRLAELDGVLSRAKFAIATWPKFGANTKTSWSTATIALAGL